MFIGRAFPTFEDGQSRVLGFDLGNFLATGETISAATATLICVSGVDQLLAQNPAARFAGDVLISGTVVTQGIVFSDPLRELVGNVYSLTIATTTSIGQIVLPWSRFAITQGYGIPQSVASPSDPAQIIVLPTPALKLTLAALGGYAEQNFAIADAGEVLLYGFDFSSALSPNETIIAASPSLNCSYGTDAPLALNPNARFVGAPQIKGSVVQQMVAWPSPLPIVEGNAYVLGLAISTAFNQAVSAWSRIAIGSTS